MKSYSLSILAAVTVLAAASITQLRADDHNGPYQHDQTGYWDEHHVHHAYVTHNNHRGYWDTRSGTRVFISL
jgi:hypothetical protein